MLDTRGIPYQLSMGLPGAISPRTKWNWWRGWSHKILKSRAKSKGEILETNLVVKNRRWFISFVKGSFVQGRHLFIFGGKWNLNGPFSSGMLIFRGSISGTRQSRSNKNQFWDFTAINPWSVGESSFTSSFLSTRNGRFWIIKCLEKMCATQFRRDDFKFSKLLIQGKPTSYKWSKITFINGLLNG